MLLLTSGQFRHHTTHCQRQFALSVADVRAAQLLQRCRHICVCTALHLQAVPAWRGHRRAHGLLVQPQTLLVEHLPRVAAARLALVAVAGAPELLAAPDAVAGLAGLRCATYMSAPRYGGGYTRTRICASSCFAQMLLGSFHFGDAHGSATSAPNILWYSRAMCWSAGTVTRCSWWLGRRATSRRRRWTSCWQPERLPWGWGRCGCGWRLLRWRCWRQPRRSRDQGALLRAYSPHIRWLTRRDRAVPLQPAV